MSEQWEFPDEQVTQVLIAGEWCSIIPDEDNFGFDCDDKQFTARIMLPNTDLRYVCGPLSSLQAVAYSDEP